jgi:glucose/arabinose dehydrogenase
MFILTAYQSLIKMKRVSFFLGLLLLLFSTPASTQTITLPSGFSISAVASGWVQPVGALFSPDGQLLFVWEKRGRIFVCKRNASTGEYEKQATPVLNIQPEVGDWSDHGLLGFAIDPNFASNGLIYMSYVVDRHYLMNFGTGSYNANTNDYFTPTIGRVTRYQTITNGSQELVADGATRTILLGETKSTGVPILHDSHGVGSLAFAADGTLLFTTGDGAHYYHPADIGNSPISYYQQALIDGIIRTEENVGSFRAQMLNSHNGKLLRLDPTNGNGVGSNPFYSAGAPRSAQSRVWAMGFRNPFRFHIRPGGGSTNPEAADLGEVYVGDVGWETYEELTIIKEAGMNAGWPLYEGHTWMSGYINQNTENRDQPNPLFGGACTQQYLYFRNLLKQATADGIKTVFNPCNAATPIGTGNQYFHRRPAIDWKHEVDSARVGIFSGNNARIAQIGSAASNVTGQPFPGNCSVAGMFYTGTLFPVNYRNTFFQADLGGRWIKCFSIDFTDVVTKVEHFAIGFNAITCVTMNPLDGTLVTVDVGAENVRRITYGGNQPPVAVVSADKTFGPTVLNVAFSSAGSLDPEGGALTYQWNFGDPASGANNTSTAANPSHNFSSPVGTPAKFVVKLTVRDAANATATDSIIISVNNTPPVVQITSPIKNSTYTPGGDTVYTLTANVSDAEHSFGQLKYEWQTSLRHNNHQHSSPIDTNRNTTSTIGRVGCDDEYYWFFKLKVTDAAGLSTTDSSKIFPACPGTFATLNGSVLLTGRPTAPNSQWQVPLQVDLYTAGNNVTPVYTHNVITDQNGNFSIPAIPAGVYTIAVKGTNTLRRVKTGQTLIIGDNAISFGTLKDGDVNNNNMINLSDLGLLLASYNKIAGDPGYNINADLNRSGAVNLSDLGLMLSNYNNLGENP